MVKEGFGLRNLMLTVDFESEIDNAVEIAVETVIKDEVEAEIRDNPILGFTDKATIKIDFATSLSKLLSIGLLER